MNGKAAVEVVVEAKAPKRNKEDQDHASNAQEKQRQVVERTMQCMLTTLVLTQVQRKGQNAK